MAFFIASYRVVSSVVVQPGTLMFSTVTRAAVSDFAIARLRNELIALLCFAILMLKSMQEDTRQKKSQVYRAFWRARPHCRSCSGTKSLTGIGERTAR